MNLKNGDTMSDRGDAEWRAEAMDAALSQSSSAAAHYLAGSWYVVTSGTGEGGDFAYDLGDVDPEDFRACDHPRMSELDPLVCDECDERCRGRDCDPETGACLDEDCTIHGRHGWDYSDWCSEHTPCEDLNVAVAYYLATGRDLHCGGACTRILTDAQREVLDIAREIQAEVAS